MPKPNVTYLMKTVERLEPRIYNILPRAVKEANNITVFKRLLGNWLFFRMVLKFFSNLKLPVGNYCMYLILYMCMNVK